MSGTAVNNSITNTARTKLVAVTAADEPLLQVLSEALPAILTPEVCLHLPPNFSDIGSAAKARALLDEMLSQSQVTAIFVNLDDKQDANPLAGLIFMHIDAQESASGASEAHLGYLLAERFWGGGIASECLSAFVAEVTKSAPVNTLVAGVEVGNLASIRLLEKLGFRLQASDSQKNSDSQQSRDSQQATLHYALDLRCHG
ncbi:GNAT family N-acetyltransferase [Shewanella khirikhana]|nr:GNAT family protein [Shewanella khirikhana]